MTAIVTGHTVYFSTTVQGGGSLQHISNQNCPYKATWTPGDQIPRSGRALVSKALQACQLLASDNSGHRTGGSCGEVMAAMAFCTVNPNGSLVRAKVVTWGNSQNVQSEGTESMVRATAISGYSSSGIPAKSIRTISPRRLPGGAFHSSSS